jgi:cytochrome P450
VSAASARPTAPLDTAFPSSDTMRCPYAYYRTLRDEAPVHRLPGGEYLISRHADVAHVTRHPELFSSHHSVVEDGRMRAATLVDYADADRAWGILTSDPPDHTWKRKLAFEMFKPGRLRDREAEIQGYVDELLDAFVERGECEFVSEFSDRLPARVILAMFGLPPEYVDRAIAWGGYEGTGTTYASEEGQRAARESILDLSAFIRDRVLERVDDSRDDDLSRHVQRHLEIRGELDMPNLVAEAINLFAAGMTTTAHLIARMMQLFIENPAEQAKARRSRGDLKKAIEETLRIESPVQFIARLAVEDTSVGGVPIPAGSILLLLLGAANRDTSVFESPETFDIERSNAKDHLAFGDGSHFCLGAPLGRLEATIAFERIFARVTDLRFADGFAPENLRSVLFRGPAELPIRFAQAR